MGPVTGSAPVVVYAAPSRGGRWHLLTGDRAACTPRLELNRALELPASRAPVQLRCGRAGCRSRWPTGISAVTRARDQLYTHHAVAALDTLCAGMTNDHTRRWATHGWLTPHIVYLAWHPALGVYRTGYTALANLTRRDQDLTRAGAELVDEVEVPTRHHAALVKTAALHLVEDYRIELPPAPGLRQGTTDAFTPPDDTELHIDSLLATALITAHHTHKNRW